MASVDTGSGNENDSDDYFRSPTPGHVPSQNEDYFDAGPDETTVDAESASHGGSNSPRKRKRAYSDVRSQFKYKRLKGQYVDGYRELYNDEIVRLSNRFNSEDTGQAPLHSQIGSSIWSSDEKATLFIALQKLGKDAVPEIAATVETKSEVQVREYLLLLQDGLTEHVLNDRYQVICSHADFPAAAELSEECCKSLEVAADSLAWYQETYDEKVEAKKYGQYWLLNRAVAEEIEEELDLAEAEVEDAAEEVVAEGEIENTTGPSAPAADPTTSAEADEDSSSDTNSDLISAIPAVKLLDLQKWLMLSNRFFMSSPKFGHWQDIADPGQEPAIFHTAFHDFHRLAVSITKRLVQASIFQAMSRVRSEDVRKTHRTQPRVYARDVRAALQIMNMTPDCREYWARMPRRLAIEVYDRRPVISRRKKTPDTAVPYNYDEVEKQLDLVQDHEIFADAPSPTEQPGTPNNDTIINSNETSSSDHDPSSDSDSASSADSITTQPSLHPARHLARQQSAHASEDQRATHLDAQHSRRTELALWDLLEQSPPPSISYLHEPPSLEPPRKNNVRKTLADLVDWREWTDYAPVWKEHGPLFPRADAQDQADEGQDVGTGAWPPARFKTPPKAKSKVAKTSKPKASQKPSNKGKQRAHGGLSEEQARAMAKARAIEGDLEPYDDEEEEAVPEGGLLQPRIQPSREARVSMGEMEDPVEGWGRFGDSEEDEEYEDKGEDSQ